MSEFAFSGLADRFHSQIAIVTIVHCVRVNAAASQTATRTHVSSSYYNDLLQTCNSRNSTLSQFHRGFSFSYSFPMFSCCNLTRVAPRIRNGIHGQQSIVVGSLTELNIHEAAREWLTTAGFETISDLAFTFVNSSDGAALLQKIPNPIWVKMGVDPDNEDPGTTVPAGKIRRLLAQCRMVVSQISTNTVDAAVGSTPTAPLASPTWQEMAPPRLTPEAVNQMVETFQTNFPGELLTSDTIPSIRLLSVVHHYMKPGQTIKYIPWQIRMSQKQYQDMTEAKTHKPIRSEAQLLGALLDDTPEISMENVRLSAEWLLRTQQVFRNAWVMVSAAHLQVFKKFDDKFFSLAMKRHSPESMLRSVNLAELLEADKMLWSEISGMLNQKWSLNDALNELTSARADMHGLLQPRPRSTAPKIDKTPSPKTPKPKPFAGSPVKKQQLKAAPKSQPNDLATFIYENGAKKPLCQRFQRGACTSKSCKYAHLCAVKIQGKPCGQKHGAHAHGSST